MTGSPPVLRTLTKRLADLASLVIVSPLAALSGAERRLRPGTETVFGACTHVVALCPGLPGAFLRRAFYRLTLDGCHPECHIGFGAIFTHRDAIIERGVYLGTWALVGSARLREGTSIGSRASLLSGTEVDALRDGRWAHGEHGRLRQISVGPHTLVGEGAIIMADVGAVALVAAGSIVASPVPAGVVVAGNPARFVRHLDGPRSDAATRPGVVPGVDDSPQSTG